MNDENTGNLTISYKLDDTHSSTISGTSELVEPLCYPLLFPYGEVGWSQDKRKSIRSDYAVFIFVKIINNVVFFSFMNYLACRLLQVEPMLDNNAELHVDQLLEDPYFEIDGEFDMTRMYCENASKTQLLPTNRFQLMAKLSSYYIVEEMCRALDFKLQWHRNKKNQDMIFGATDNSDHLLPEFDEDVTDEEFRDLPPMDEDRRDDEKSFLADSYFGSERHLKRQAQNALTVVSEVGRPTVFITLTCNTHWPEIVERLFEGQTAFEREDVVCAVFKARLEAFLFNLRFVI